jgi:hypothetical protein
VMWTGLVWLRIGIGSCEFGIKPSGSIKCWETKSGITTGGISSSAHLYRVNEKIKPPLFATISYRAFIIHVSYYMFRLYISHL